MNSWVSCAPTAFVRDRTRASGFIVRRANHCTTETLNSLDSNVFWNISWLVIRYCCFVDTLCTIQSKGDWLKNHWARKVRPFSLASYWEKLSYPSHQEPASLCTIKLHIKQKKIRDVNKYINIHLCILDGTRYACIGNCYILFLY